MYTDASVSSSGGSAGGNSSNPGLSSVSSSGYMSPSVITLDSPSPPATPTPPAPSVPPVQPLPGRSPGLRMPPPMFPNSMYLSSVPTFLDLDSDSNSPQSSSAAPLYPPRYWTNEVCSIPLLVNMMTWRILISRNKCDVDTKSLFVSLI